MNKVSIEQQNAWHTVNALPRLRFPISSMGTVSIITLTQGLAKFFLRD